MNNRTRWMAALFAAAVMLLVGASRLAAQSVSEKKVYIPASFADPTNEASQWCYARSVESENFVVFWEAGYGSDPSKAPSPYTINMDAVLDIAERSFALYADSLKFIIRGQSKTDRYKMIIRLFHTTEWMATGLGEDDVIGELNLSANAAQALGVTVAHEVGHCFQYQVYADQGVGGWRYGLGDGGAGGNGFWEQCAQWQAFKVFPEQQFTDYRFSEYLNNTHKHILHEAPRYANYFIQDYWCHLHGQDFIGRLWRKSVYPQDPVQAYIAINRINQELFNDRMYDCAARFATWDIPALRERGADFIDRRPQPSMTRTDDGYWQIDASHCPENYGHNIIRLNAPSEATRLTLCFNGLAGEAGYRMKNKVFAGWRYGFVALLKDGTRVYGDMHRGQMVTLKNPVDTVAFDCPADCEKLWLVVTGAPQKHWRHQWDDDDSNDEQWPYRVKLEGTDLYGHYSFDPDAAPRDTTIHCYLVQEPTVNSGSVYPSTPVQSDAGAVCQAFCMSLADVKAAFGSSIVYAAINPNGYVNRNSTANHPGHWFNRLNTVTTWGSSAYIFSELDINSLTFNIGQYPNRCRSGEEYTIRQALIYTPSKGKPVRATFVFHISIRDAASIAPPASDAPVSYAWQAGRLVFSAPRAEVVLRDLSGRPVARARHASSIDASHLSPGIYLLTTDGTTRKIVKRK